MTASVQVHAGETCDEPGCPAGVQVAVLTPAGPLGFCVHHLGEHIEALADYPAAFIGAQAREAAAWAMDAGFYPRKGN